MRLSLSLNGTPKFIASQPGPGYLNAHVNLRNRPKENHQSRQMWVVGTITDETETTRLEWPTLELAVGDIVELGVMPDGEGDPPIKTKKSSEAPSNLLTNVELAKEVFATISDIDGRLMKLLEKAEKLEPSEESKKFRHAIGSIIYELGEQLLYPVFRRHKELIPDELKGELL